MNLSTGRFAMYWYARGTGYFSLTAAPTAADLSHTSCILRTRSAFTAGGQITALLRTYRCPLIRFSTLARH